MIFLDQITTLDRRYLLSFEELELKKYIKLNKKKRISPKYARSYDNIIEELTVSKATYRIKSEICDKIVEIDEVITVTPP